MCLVAADVSGWSGQESYVGFYLGSDWAPVPTRFSLSQRLGYLGAQCACLLRVLTGCIEQDVDEATEITHNRNIAVSN